MGGDKVGGDKVGGDKVGGDKWKPLWSGALQVMSYKVYEGKTCYVEGGGEL